MWQKFRDLTLLQKIAVGLLLLLVPLIVVAHYKPVGIFYSNQHLYYLNGMYSAGVEFLQNDPLAGIRPVHIVFSMLVFVLQKMNWLAGGSQFFAALQFIVFAVGCILISLAIVKDWRGQSPLGTQRNVWVVAMVIMGLFVLMMNRIPIADLRGMAFMDLLTTYIQASSFGVFVLLGIGLLAFQRWRLATIAFTIAAMMHSFFLIVASPLMLLILYETYRQGKWREGFILCAIYGIINLPFFILGPLQWSQLMSEEAIYTMNFVRSPHHYDVSYWWNEVELIRLLLMGLATVLAIWKLPAILRNIMVFYFTFIVAGIVIAAFTQNEVVVSLHPWRSSTFILPISELIIVATVVIIIFDLIPQRVHTPILVIVCGMVVIYWFSLNPLQWPEAYRDYTSPEIEMVRAHTDLDNIILIPPRMDDNFRLYAQRPTFVMWKTTGYFIDDWYNRILIAEEMMTANIERQHEICADYTFDYYLMPVDATAVNDVTPVASTDDYLLVSCPTVQ